MSLRIVTKGSRLDWTFKQDVPCLGWKPHASSLVPIH
jgi:hypothetical protein